MEGNKRNYVLLAGIARPEEPDRARYRWSREETYRQFTLRTQAGVPLVSEQEKIYEQEEAAQTERRLGLFWESFPLIMRNWKNVLKHPALSEIPMDPIGVVYGMKGVTLGSLVFAWRASRMCTVCPKCGGTAYFLPYVEDYFLGPWNPQDDFPEVSHVYCSDCGAEDRYYDYNYDPEATCRHFYYLLENWKRCHRPAGQGMLFETAMHLLKLCEIYGETPEEIITNF